MDIIGLWLAVMLAFASMLVGWVAYDMLKREMVIKKERKRYGGRKCK